MSDVFGALGIAASGMAAERLRLDVTSANLANANTTRGVDGKPYARQEVALQAGGVETFSDVLTGVQVAGIINDPSPPGASTTRASRGRRAGLRAACRTSTP